MKRKFKICLLVFLVVVVLAVSVMFFLGKESGSESFVRDPVILDSESLPAYLENYKLIDELPRETNIQLRVGTTGYTIVKGDVKSGFIDDPDVSISLPEEYFIKLGYGLCPALRNAVKNGEMKAEMHLSKTKLLWKYKGLMKHKDCLGF